MQFIRGIAFLLGMSQGAEIVCHPTRWFYWRVLMMLVMFAGFGAYFFYDYKVGYPEKNWIYSHYRAFHQAGRDWDDVSVRENWESHASSQKIAFEGDSKTGTGPTLAIPQGYEREQNWPETLHSRELMEEKGWEKLWQEYAGERSGWPQHLKLEEGFYTDKKIKEQLYFGIFCSALALGALFVFVRTRGRSMKVDDQAFYAPTGQRIPFTDITKIDKRKWETKGLATITYQEGGVEKKVKVDGMVYGQFREEDGAPAEALFQRVLANFSGELIELLRDEDEVTEDTADSAKPV